MSTSTSGSATRRKAPAATKNWWMKWEFARWLNEPTLITAGNAVQGFWFNLLNRMGIAQSPTLEDTPEGYALLGLCREAEVASRLHALRMLNIADVEECGGRVRVTCRSMVRQMEKSRVASENARKRWEKRKAAAAGDAPEASVTPEVTGFRHNSLQGVLHMQTAMQSSNSGSYSSSFQEVEVQEEKPASAPAMPPAAVVTSVMQATMLSSPFVARALEAVATGEIGRGRDPGELSATMVAAWRRFESVRPQLRYSVGAQAFFGEGHWRDPAGWPWKENAAPPGGVPGASIGMRREEPAATDEDPRATALGYWRLVAGKNAEKFDRECPAWAREALAAERRPPESVSATEEAMRSTA